MKKVIITAGFVVLTITTLLADSTSTAYKKGRNSPMPLIAAVTCVVSSVYLFYRGRKAKQ